MSKVTWCFAYFCVAMSIFPSLVVSATEKGASQRVSAENDVAHYQQELTLSGTTIRKRFFLSVYKLSHFMAWTHGQPSSKEALVAYIVNTDVPQRIELEFLRDVSRDQIEEALLQGIERNNADAELSQIKKEIRRLSTGFNDDVKKHSTLTLSRPSKDKLRVSFNNKLVVETDNKGLADALWSIWFGKYPIVDTEELIKNIIEK